MNLKVPNRELTWPSVFCVFSQLRNKEEEPPGGGAKEQVLMSRANKYPESKIRAHQTHTFLMEDHKDCDPGHQCDGTTQFTECEEGSMCRRNSKITVTDSQIQQKACFKGFSYSSKGE